MKHFFKTISNKLSKTGFTKSQLITVFLCYFLCFALFLGVVVIWDPMSKSTSEQTIAVDDTTPTGPTNVDGSWITDDRYSIEWFRNAEDGVGSSADNPYIIDSAEDLAGLSWLVYTKGQEGNPLVGNTDYSGSYIFRGKYFKQTANIDLSLYYWQPIGINYTREGTTRQNYFSGNYDGDNHTVSGIFTPAGTSTGYSYQGLFGYVGPYDLTYPVTIKNTGIINSFIQGYNFVGGVVGFAGLYTTITNCYNTGSVESTGRYVGGVVGWFSEGITITNCFNTGDVTGSGNHVGGVVGRCDVNRVELTIFNCYNTGDVTSTSTNLAYVGGVVGDTYNSYIGTVNIVNCYNTGSVNGAYRVGGVVGYAHTTTITNCYNTGTISCSRGDVGGILGYNDKDTTITNCYNTGAVTGSSNVGGVVGNASTSSGSTTITNCYNTGAVITWPYGGGVVGSAGSNAIITNCYYGGGVTGTLGSYGTYLADITDLAKTLSWYTTKSNWDSAYPWNFGNVWKIDTSINDGYPTFTQDWWINEGNYSIDWYVNAQEIEIDGVTYEPGDKENPYKISTAADLAGLSYLTYFGSASNSLNPSDIDKEVINGIECNVLFKGVYFEQSASFDLSSFIWQPIGLEYDRAGSRRSNPFSGNYDGKNFTITGVHTPAGSTDAYSFQGLFGIIGNSTIRNVNVSNSQIEGYEVVGGIVGGGANKSKVINCSFSGDVIGRNNVGGIVGGLTNAQVLGCENFGNVSSTHVDGSNSIGGIVGGLSFDYTGSIDKSFTFGVNSETFVMAMLSAVEKSTNYGVINGEGSNNVGGIVGRVESFKQYTFIGDNVIRCPYIFDCVNRGKVLGLSNTGGIVGYFRAYSTGYSTVDIGNMSSTDMLRIGHCANYGAITSSKPEGSSSSCRAGGIVGYAKLDFGTLNVTNSYNLGDITGLNGVGGIIGGIDTITSRTRDVIDSCYNGGKIVGNFSLGALVGYSIGDETEQITGDDGSSSYVSYMTCYVKNSYNLGSVYDNLNQAYIDSNSALSLYGRYFLLLQDSLDPGEMLINSYTSSDMTGKGSVWVRENLKWDFGYVWDSSSVGAVNGMYNPLAFSFKNEDGFDWWISEDLVDIDFEGSGTEDDPYLISSASELAGLSYLVYNYPYVNSDMYDEYNITDDFGSDFIFTNVYFKQTADIDMSGHMWQPIGVGIDRTLHEKGRYFSGNYDGAGYSISNLTTPFGEGENYLWQGLFGSSYGFQIDTSTNLPIDFSVNIKNVHIKNSNIFGFDGVGSVAGFGFISNCSNEGGSIKGNSGVGGLVGGGYVDKSYNKSAVIGNSGIGGLVGVGAAINSYNFGNVSGASGVGGVIGSQSEFSKFANIRNCYNVGQVSGDGEYVGGIIGQGNSVSNSFNLGEVLNSDITDGFTAGLIGGTNSNLSITRSYYGGDCKDFGDGNYSSTLANDVRNESFLASGLNWDIYFTWKISEDLSYPYPVLRENEDRNWWIGEDFNTGLANYDISWFTDAGNGVGDSEQNPYILYDAADLAGLSYLVYYGEYTNKNGEQIQLPSVSDLVLEKFEGIYFVGKYFKLANDIDLSGKLWQPIGVYNDKLIGDKIAHAFGGNFDGNGHTISGITTMTISGKNDALAGLFGIVSGGVNQSGSGDLLFMANLKNIKIVDSSIQGFASVGSVAGLSVLTNITNCYSSSLVGVNGGVVMYENGFGLEMASYVYNAAGIVGTSMFSNIERCTFTGEVFGDASYFDMIEEIGGIVYVFLGGIVGYSYSDSSYPAFQTSNYGFGTIRDCYNYSDVGNSTRLSNMITISGGIVARITGTEVYDCYNYGSIQGIMASGGIAGMNAMYTIYPNFDYNNFRWNYFNICANHFCGCVNFGLVSGGMTAGGILGFGLDLLASGGDGYTSPHASFDSCANFGTVTNKLSQGAKDWVQQMGPMPCFGLGGIYGAYGVATAENSVVNCVVDCTIDVDPEIEIVGGIGAVYGYFFAACRIEEGQGPVLATYKVIKNCTIKVDLLGYNVTSSSSLIIGFNEAGQNIEDLVDNVILKYGQQVFKINGREYISSKIDDTLRLTDNQGKVFTDNTINVNGKILSFTSDNRSQDYLFFDENGDLFASRQRVFIYGVEYYVFYDFVVGQAKFIPVNGGSSIYASGNELSYNGEIITFSNLSNPEPEGTLSRLSCSNSNVTISGSSLITINGTQYKADRAGQREITLTDSNTGTTYQYFNGMFYIDGTYYTHSYENGELVLSVENTDEKTYKQLSYDTGLYCSDATSLEDNFVYIDYIMEGLPVPIKTDGTNFFHMHDFGSTTGIIEKINEIFYPNLIEEPFITTTIEIEYDDQGQEVIIMPTERIPYEIDLVPGKEYVVTLYVNGVKIVRKVTAEISPENDMPLLALGGGDDSIYVSDELKLYVVYIISGGYISPIEGYITTPGQTGITAMVERLDGQIPDVCEVELVSVREFTPTNLLDEPIVIETSDDIDINTMTEADLQVILDRSFNLQVGSTYKVTYNFTPNGGETLNGEFVAQTKIRSDINSEGNTISYTILSQENQLGEYMYLIEVIDNAKFETVVGSRLLIMLNLKP